jgi:hypothetical protein
MTRDAEPAAATPAFRMRAQADEQIATILEPGQLVAETQQAIPRAQLSRRAHTALWALRIFVIVTSAMVIYTFFSQLRP